MSIDCSLKSLTSAGSNELLQSHNSLTFKLLKTVADFSQALATLHDNFGHELQMLVETFRKRNGELRKERLHCPNSLFQVWELFLQQVEVNSQQHGDISRNFSQTIGSGLIERVFHRKIQSKKIFAYRDRIETILLKSNELLLKCYQDYCQSYALALSNPAQYMSEYIASHNVYVHQLQATNGMIHAYQTKTLPKLLEELEECHLEISGSISTSLLDSSELVSEKSNEQSAGYQSIAAACRQANHKHDLAQFVKLAGSIAINCAGSGGQAIGAAASGALNSNGDYSSTNNSTTNEDGSPKPLIRYHQFQSASLQNVASNAQFDPKNMQLVPTFKNEIAPDLSQPPAQQKPQLEKDRESLEEKMEKFEERIESLSKLLARSRESRLNNKVNEIQEELCQKRFDLLVAQIHLSAVRSQLQLFEYSYRPSSSATGVGHAHLLALAAGADATLLNGPTSGGDEQPGGGPLQGSESNGSANASSGSLSRKTSSNVNSQSGGGGAGSSASLAPGNGQSSSSNQSGGGGGVVGYRGKWIKAFKSLKESPTSSNSSNSGNQQKSDDPSRQHEGQQQSHISGSGSGLLGPENQHFFQEYTFKKIASCDVCKDFLRGHMRQGVKCKLCKISCHNDCQTMAHTTLKCQQPKIKLLRRQKSAGELEVNNLEGDGSNNADGNERSSGLKPDSIYQLIRQVLEAKKKGGGGGNANQHQQHHHSAAATDSEGHLRVAGAYGAGGPFAGGSLALSNQGGKSVSTSALGSTALNASVDRWAVVMDLLAESRKKEREEAGEMPKLSEGKRLSKQLDKFKLAAKSAAAVSKHQRHYLQQQQQQQQQQPQPQQQQSPQSPQSQLAGSPQDQQQQQHANQPARYQPEGYQQAGWPQEQAYLGPPAPLEAQQQHGVHHTKSLPVGKQLAGSSMAMHQVQQQQQQQAGMVQMQQPAEPNLMMRHASGGGPPDAYATNQLLSIGAQQLQSTSAPHSPQRKRFNLRMKSFSLDSPESPSVVGVAGVLPNGPASYATGAHSASSSGLGEPAQYAGQPQQQQYQQQLYPGYPQQPEVEAGYLYQQQQRQQQQQRAYEDSQLAAYLSANEMRSGRHSSAGNGQQLYHHRHSYHNPSIQYQPGQQQQQQQQQLVPQQQHELSSSQSALNSMQLAPGGSGHFNNLLPDQQLARNKHRAGSSAGGLNSNAGASGNSISQQDNNNNNNNNNKKRIGSSDNVARDSSKPANLRQEYYELGPHQQPQQQQQQQAAVNTHVVLYDYAPQRNDELQLNAGQLVGLVEAGEPDWWKVSPLDGSSRIGYFPASYLAALYPGERPLQVVQTIQVSNGEMCDKLLRGQIVIHTGKQMDGFVSIRTVTGTTDCSNHFIQCPEKYLMELVDNS